MCHKLNDSKNNDSIQKSIAHGHENFDEKIFAIRFVSSAVGRRDLELSWANLSLPVSLATISEAAAAFSDCFTWSTCIHM